MIELALNSFPTIVFWLFIIILALGYVKREANCAGKTAALSLNSGLKPQMKTQESLKTDSRIHSPGDRNHLHNSILAA